MAELLSATSASTLTGTELVPVSQSGFKAATTQQFKDFCASALFSSSTAGIVPASGGGATNFLRADGTWAAPPGGGGGAWGSITGTLASQTDLQAALDAKQAAGSYLTGNQTVTLSGDASGSGATAITVTVGKINGTALSGLATGILKNTTGTGVPSIAVAADFPTLNQNTTGSAATLTASRNFSISGGGITAAAVAFNGSADVVLSSSVDAGHITLARMANVATGTVFYRKTAGTGVPEVQTLATLKTDLGLTGTNSGDQTITLTSDVTGSGTGSFATTIAAGAVTLAKMANLAANSIIGNNTGSSATPIALTVAQVKTLLGMGTAAALNMAVGTTAPSSPSVNDLWVDTN
jgi:hypothetical protein